MVLKQLFIAGSLSFTLALQGWGKGDRPIRRNRRGKAPEPDKYFV